MTWTTPPGSWALCDGEVHVWRLSLDPPSADLAGFEPTLNDDELRRANRFRTAALRRRFVAGRGALRAILASYLDCDAGGVVFSYGNHGKPRLAQATGLEFNLAHTADLALCAVTLGRAVGVDVEEVRRLDNAERIIGRFFSEVERAEFLARPESERLEAFYRGWSRKEAFLKATGTGLATQLDSFDVSLGPRASLLRVGDDPDEPARWSLLDLDAGPAVAAALATRGAVSALTLKTWQRRS